MANVSPRRLCEADRAQLFLIGALALSVIFVVLAVLLNTAIYTGNIATRDPGPGTGEVVEYEGEAASMADATLTVVNDRNNSSYSALRSNYSNTIAVWSNAANAHTVADLADAHLSVVTTNRGSKIGQETQNGFVNDTGGGNWTVANDTAARAFRMNVSQPSLLDITGGLLTESFYVGFNDSTGEWKAYVYQEGANNVSVDVVHPNGSQIGSTCSVDTGSDDHAVIELSTAQVGGQPCPAFTKLFRGLSAPYNVTYTNAVDGSGNEQINGTYSVVVDRPIGDLETGADENTGEPYTAPALYSADLQITYRSSVVYYRTNLRVAPEEPDV